MSNLLNDIVTSDAASNLAAGTEATFRGLLPKGTFDALEVGLGGAKQAAIDSRKAALPGSGAVELGASMLRDTAAMALGGPAALYGIAALNTVGDAAQHVVNHDVNLTAEYMASSLLGEMLSAAVGHAAGPVMNATGRVLVKGAQSVAGKMVAKGSKLEVAAIADATKEALESGLFARGRKAATEHVDGNIKALNGKIGTLVGTFDKLAADVPAPSPAAQGWLDTIKPFRAKIEGSLNLDLSTVTPSKIRTAEEWLAKEAQQTTGSDSAWVAGVRDRSAPMADKYFAEIGLSPVELRALEREVSAQEAVRKAIPIDAVPTLAKAGLKTAAASAGTAAVYGIGAQLGLPHALTSVVAAGVGLKSLAHSGLSKALIPEVAAAGKAVVAQGAYNLGSALSEFDRGVLAQTFANKYGAELGTHVSRALTGQGAISGGVAMGGIGALTDAHLEKLQTYLNNPTAFHKEAFDAVADAPIPDEQKAAVVNTMAQALQTVQPDLPKQNPLAPPAARALTASAKRRLEQTLTVATQPAQVLANPRPDTLATLQRLYPATHATAMQHALTSAGPNVAPGTKARGLLDAYGADQSVRAAGQHAQQLLYAPRPLSAPKQAPRRQTTTNVELNIVETTPTGIDRIQKGP